MIVVLDASGAAEIAAKSQAGVDFINVLMHAERVLAPELYIAEICNVMWKLARRDKASRDIYVDMADDCISYVDEYISNGELWKEALKFAQEHDHTVYDMLYATLAKRHDATLLTMDKRLCTVCDKLTVRHKSFILPQSGNS